MQEWLDKSAILENNGQKDSQEYRELLLAIMLHRSDAPPCHGDDDCSTMQLVSCPWRFDCGEKGT
jgi:hypothetical protein